MDPITDHIIRAVRVAVREELQVAGASRFSQRLLTIAQTAEYLGCSPNQVRNLEAAGIIKRFVWPIEQERRTPYYDRVELDRRIDEITAQHAGAHS
jgi:DNA-binding Lrp family transcriptional regulator